MREYKVVVLGSGGVGKSALTVQFVTRTFIEKYDPTFEDFYRKEIELDSSPSVLEILYSAGTEQFASFRDLYIKNDQGFILVYSLVRECAGDPCGEQGGPGGREGGVLWRGPGFGRGQGLTLPGDELFTEVVRQMDSSSLPDREEPCCGLA